MSSACLKNLPCTADMGTRNDMMKNDMKNGKDPPNLSALNSRVNNFCDTLLCVNDMNR